ncbi:head-tail connector protein [Rhizobium rhizogenes]|uniref:head-tail connector protein n=1 Tax=Rhizobium rhizogenes TaxID=359 RepID=UPI0015725E01|nr:head-tail connector protein [Rhizobium rhizogenes]MDJ1632521.1 head-tail connector protein [Rhizobium rhizogenes]NTI41603.1 phage gp6-like head-tail connector protein [Rhizobium rhizogenes]
MIVDRDVLKQELNFTDGLGETDDALIDRKIAAAQDHIERLLGFKIEETYGGEGQDPIPPALVEAVCLLAAHWYENREATLVGVVGQELPFGVWSIVNEYREFSFG